MNGLRPILVTGAAGFIGAAVCRHLHEAGEQVVAFDNLSRGRRKHLPPQVALIEGDIRDAPAWRRAVEDVGPRAVVHLAAMHFIPDCIARPAETRAVNVEGTRCVLAALRRPGVEHVVFASTAAVYAPTETPCREDDTPLGPLEVYGESKLEGERLMRQLASDARIACTTLRLFNAVGRGETNPHVIPHIFESLQRSDTVPLGNIEPKRDYIDTRDIAGAVAAVLRSPAGFRVLNVGSGRAYSVADVIASLRALLVDRPITIHQDAARVRATERMTLVADIARIAHASGWRPRYSLDDSLRDLIDAYSLGHARTRAHTGQPPVDAVTP